MSIYNYEQAFGAWDKTTAAMRKAIEEWFSMYFQQTANDKEDPCQRVPYTVVNKLVKTIFGEYNVQSTDPVVCKMVEALDHQKKTAVQLALVGGECYIKPYPEKQGFSFTLIPRNNVLIFGRNANGEPTDIGTVEHSTQGQYYYTLLERRTVDERGYLTIRNQLYQSRTAQNLGNPVPLQAHPDYQQLTEYCCYPLPVGSVGLVRMKTPMLNCVDGSADGVSAYAAAVGLIHNINRNEEQMNGEFNRGESRIIASSDLLKQEGLVDHLFVGLDEDPEHVGLTIFSPNLREQSFLARKQEYLRNVESVIGLKRGMLSDANMDDRTATEITASTGEYSLTVIDFQQMWEQTLHKTVQLCMVLAQLYHMELPKDTAFSIDWGNGVLYDEQKTWEQYKGMVEAGLLKPEIALGWRFHQPVDTQENLQVIRERYMPGADTQ